MKFNSLFEPSRDELSETNFEQFGEQLDPIVEESLLELQKNGRNRKGTLFTSKFTAFFVFLSTIRRDLAYPKVLNWLFSSLRWLTCNLPKKIVSDGTITKARQYLGVEVFRLIFDKFVAQYCSPLPDFYGRCSVAFDGVCVTIPDTPDNQKVFGKPSNGRSEAAFPQIRAVALMSLTLRCIIGIAYGPFTGKGTGERNLMTEILQKFRDKKLLFLLDAGLYSFELLEYFKDSQQEFLMKLNANIKVKRIKYLEDGSYLGIIKKQYKNPQSTSKKRLPQIIKEIEVRVIPYQINGFRAARLVTNILDENITARELVVHYHQRWDIEIAFDEIKTHQCATLRGQTPTVFRSKTAELVEQELYAILRTINCIRHLMVQAGDIHNKEPRLLSFLDTLQLIIDAVPMMYIAVKEQVKLKFNYLLSLIADSDIDRPRRDRINPRVVKLKSSKFKRKNRSHIGSYRNFDENLQIIQPKTA